MKHAQNVLRLEATAAPDLCCNPTLSFPVELMARVFPFILLLISLPATAQIYKYTDANGTTTYSNQPPTGANARAVELQPLNSIESQPPGKPAPPIAPSSEQPPSTLYEVLELTGLPTGEALRANNGNVTVEVLIKPHLQDHHLLRLLLDDQPYGQPSNVPTLQLLNVARGEHRLAVQVIERQSIVQQSHTVTFTVQRASKP